MLLLISGFAKCVAMPQNTVVVSVESGRPTGLFPGDECRESNYGFPLRARHIPWTMPTMTRAASGAPLLTTKNGRLLHELILQLPL